MKKITKKIITEEFANGELVKRITEETIEEEKNENPFHQPLLRETPNPFPLDRGRITYYKDSPIS